MNILGLTKPVSIKRPTQGVCQYKDFVIEDLNVIDFFKEKGIKKRWVGLGGANNLINWVADFKLDMVIIKDVANPSQMVLVKELFMKFANKKSEKKLIYHVPHQKSKTFFLNYSFSGENFF